MLIISRQIEAISHNIKSVAMSTEEWWLLDEITRSTVQMHLAENAYFTMAKELTIFALWEKLQMIYEKKSSSSRVILIRQLLNMKMKSTEPTTSHSNTFSRVLTELSSQGLNFEEEVNLLALIASLPMIWEVFYKTVTNSSTKLKLVEPIGGRLRRKSMGLTINDNVEAYFSRGMA